MAEPNDKELRGPVNLRIKFRSASLQQFIERYGVDVSRGGIFIRTREPLPVGTRLKLDFQLVDSAPLFQGDGTVVWIREYDPGKTGVTPGMGVRFDRLTPGSQPTLDKILEEKMRLQQTGVAPGAVVKAGAGLAVRRPSGVVTTLDAHAPPKSPPPPPGAASEAKMDAPSVGAAPVTTMPASQSRSGPVASSTGGIFSRPRTTGTMSALRAAPVPSALFEQPTAADIDKALLALEEKGPSPSLPLPPPPAPISVAPSTVGDDEPTKVFDVAAQDFAVHEAVTGQGAVLPESGVPVADGDEDGNNDLTAKRSLEPSAPVVQSSKDAPTAPHVATSLDAPLAAHLDGTSAEAGAAASGVPKNIVVDSQSRAVESGRFRSDTKYRRSSRKGGKIVLAVLLAGAAAAGIVFGKRELDKRKAAAPAVATTPAPVEPPTPAPAPSEPAGVGAPGTPPPAPAAGAPGAPAGANDIAGAAPSPSPTAPAPPAETKTEVKAAAPPGKAETAATPTKPPKSGSGRKQKPTAPAAAAPIAATPDKVEKTDTPAPAPAAGEQRPPAEAAAAAAPAPTAASGEAPKTAEAAPVEKPVLKITSTPAGAEVVIDGSSVGTTPFQSKDVDPTAAHAITVRKDGFEAHERMISGSDWARARSGAQSLKMNIKLKRTGPPPAEAPKNESGGKASDVEILTPSEP